MDVKLLAQHMYNSIQGQLDEINRDEIKRKCGWRPQLYFFALEEFRTIEGVKVLEEQGLRDTVKAALAAAYRRNLELGS